MGDGINSDDLESIKKIIIDPIVQPLQEQLNDIKLTLREMEALYKSQMELGNYVRELKHSQQICSIDCKNRLDVLEQFKQKQIEKPKENRAIWKDIFYFAVSSITLYTFLKAIGLLK